MGMLNFCSDVHQPAVLNIRRDVGGWDFGSVLGVCG